MVESIFRKQAGALPGPSVTLTTRIGQAKQVGKRAAYEACSNITLSEAAVDRLNIWAPPIDMERVKKIATQIEAGSYQIEPEKVASKMLELELNHYVNYKRKDANGK